MKRSITRFSVVLTIVIALGLLMSFARPQADDAKQYIIITSRPVYKSDAKEDFEKEVSQKLSEGWRLQGGVSANGSSFTQALMK
jgi:hypothetical protein